jgi:site-specific DNA-methyltransferase (adenine-specific)
MKPKANHHYPGDCLAILPRWPAETFDACIADPPYGNLHKNARASDRHLFNTYEEYETFSISWAVEVARLLKPNANLWVFCNHTNRLLLEWLFTRTLHMKLINTIAWIKVPRAAHPMRNHRLLKHTYETILWLCNGKTGWAFDYALARQLNGGKQLPDVWDFERVPNHKRHHVMEKPVELAQRLMLIGTNENDLILDPFVGTGTTNVAAINTGRRFVSVEADPTLTPIIAERISDAVRRDPDDPAFYWKCS